jgi:hypothetical protein
MKAPNESHLKSKASTVATFSRRRNPLLRPPYPFSVGGVAASSASLHDLLTRIDEIIADSGLAVPSPVDADATGRRSCPQVDDGVFWNGATEGASPPFMARTSWPSPVREGRHVPPGTAKRQRRNSFVIHRTAGDPPISLFDSWPGESPDGDDHDEGDSRHHRPQD